jgi:hypothetical protein
VIRANAKFKKASQRISESPADRADRRNKQAARTGARRENETPEETKVRNNKEAARTGARRENETPDETKVRLNEQATRTGARRENETPRRPRFVIIRKLQELEHIARMRPGGVQGSLRERCQTSQRPSNE